MFDLNGKNILVTGGSGFIGSNFIRLCFEKYPKTTIINVDKMGVGSIEGLTYPGRGYAHVDMDISDNRNVFNEFSYSSGPANYPIHYIFHFAAESHVDRSINDPTQFIRNNVNTTANILEFARIHHPTAKIVCISTDEVYGHLNEKDPAFTVDSPLNPRSPYASSKASSDLIALSYRTTFDMNIAITRCCNNFGENQNDEKFIPTIIRNIALDTEIPVYGNGKNVREWIHVDGHNEAILFVAASLDDGPKEPIWNIGSGIEMSNLDLILYIADIMGTNPKIRFVQDRKAHDFRYAIENTVPMVYQKTQFKKLMTDTVEFYLKKFAGNSPQ